MKRNATSVITPFVTLIKRCREAGHLSGKGCVLLFIYFLKMILIIPTAFLQKLIYARRIAKTTIDSDPVFILGHYRSGTTYLHKLMATDNRFGFLSYYDIICPNTSLLFGTWLKQFLQFLIRKLKIKTAFFNNTIPSLCEPAEEERFLINKGSAYTDYWRFVFPLCWDRWLSCSQRIKKDVAYDEAWTKEYKSMLQLATYKNKTKRLLLKSPPNTERISLLLALFPAAKFIYIRRNPYHVFYSMRNLWHKAIKKFSLQHIPDQQIEEIVLSHYEYLMERYQEDKHLIPACNLIEISYEALEADSLLTLESIYYDLNLPDFNKAKLCFEAQIGKEKKYQKFRYKYDKEASKKIGRRWEKYISEYDEKAMIAAVDDCLVN